MRTKQQRAEVKKLFKRPVTPFEKIDLSTAAYVPPRMTRAYRNTRFTVMVFDNADTTHGKAIQVLIQRHDDQPITNHWSEIQRIKNEIFGQQTTAVEYYPAESDLVNLHNIYWIWIYPDGVLPRPILPSDYYKFPNK
jgi:hypothetical protein